MEGTCGFSSGSRTSSKAPIAVAFYGPTKQLAEKLMFLKGMAFRPYVNAL